MAEILTDPASLTPEWLDEILESRGLTGALVTGYSPPSVI